MTGMYLYEGLTEYVYLYVGLKVMRCSLNPLKTVPFCINHLMVIKVSHKLMTTMGSMMLMTMMIVHPSWSVSITLTPSSMSLVKDSGLERTMKMSEIVELIETTMRRALMKMRMTEMVTNLMISARVCSSLKLRSPHQKTQS